MTEPSRGNADRGRRDAAPTASAEKPPTEGEATPEQPVVHHYGVPAEAPRDADRPPRSGPAQH